MGRPTPLYKRLLQNPTSRQRVHLEVLSINSASNLLVARSALEGTPHLLIRKDLNNPHAAAKRDSGVDK